MDLPWDGSLIGPITADNIINDQKYPGLRGHIWTLCLPVLTEKGEESTLTVRCYRRKIDNSYPAIVDELKPLFRLQKVGCHRLYYENKMYLIQRLDRVDLDRKLGNYWPPSNSLNAFRTEVQDLFAFRDAVCLTVNQENCVHIGQRGSIIYPISFYDSSPAFGTKIETFPKRISERWFGKTSMDEVYRRFFRVNSFEEISIRTNSIRTQIEEVIMRIDKNLIFYCSEIINRISERLNRST